MSIPKCFFSDSALCCKASNCPHANLNALIELLASHIPNALVRHHLCFGLQKPQSHFTRRRKIIDLKTSYCYFQLITFQSFFHYTAMTLNYPHCSVCDGVHQCISFPEIVIKNVLLFN